MRYTKLYSLKKVVLINVLGLMLLNPFLLVAFPPRDEDDPEGRFIGTSIALATETRYVRWIDTRYFVTSICLRCNTAVTERIEGADKRGGARLGVEIIEKMQKGDWKCNICKNRSTELLDPTLPPPDQKFE